ncbi:uncharacterized protein [Spinacia oleracea]|uniref:Retrotransposon gag domain-containing protein n=1 Tax=Spinacia oleracea TaxID=3562 RepID=A0A9R0JIQ2_SPIOL|nr:uncharacterized protein LOC110775867 [Spinacia oleracea]
MCFVDGTLPKPTGVTEAIAWDRANNMVCGWILRSLGPATAKSVLLLRIARDAWKDLEDRFGHSSVAQLYSLQQELLNMSQGNGDISTFFTKMKVLWDQLDDANPIPYCECGACTCNLTKKFMKIQHDQRLVHFLMKLKEAYQQVRSNVLMMEVDAPLEGDNALGPTNRRFTGNKLENFYKGSSSSGMPSTEDSESLME